MNSQSDNTHQPLDEAELRREIEIILRNPLSLDRDIKALMRLFQSQLAAAKGVAYADCGYKGGNGTEVRAYAKSRAYAYQSQADTNQSNEGGE